MRVLYIYTNLLYGGIFNKLEILQINMDYKLKYVHAIIIIGSLTMYIRFNCIAALYGAFIIAS